MFFDSFLINCLLKIKYVWRTKKFISWVQLVPVRTTWSCDERRSLYLCVTCRYVSTYIYCRYALPRLSLIEHINNTNIYRVLPLYKWIFIPDIPDRPYSWSPKFKKNYSFLWLNIASAAVNSVSKNYELFYMHLQILKRQQK